MFVSRQWFIVGAVVGVLAAISPGCSGKAPCSAATCTGGCCDSAGECQPGNQLNACGSSGILCSACMLGQTCANGFCTTVGTGGGPAGGAGGGTAGGVGGGTAGGAGGGTAGGAGGGTAGGFGGGTAGGFGGGTAGGFGGGTAGGFGGGTAGGTAGGTGGGTASCPTLITEVFGSGGCVLYLTAPANCSTINFNNPSGYVEFSWTTTGTMCEGPHSFLIGGNPPTTWEAGNGVEWSLPSTSGNEYPIDTGIASTYSMVRNIGGYVHLRRSDLAGVTTDNGQYHWIVSGFYAISNGGSHSASRTFYIAP